MQSRMQRLVCIVEGHGEVDAMPRLCQRIILESLKAENWYVDEHPIRRPRSQLVDESKPSPSRPRHEGGLQKALAIAEARKPTAVLLMCDSDKDCPGVWCSSVAEKLHHRIRGSAVMAVCEFECWLLWDFDEDKRRDVKALDPERIRDAKGRLERLVPAYAPSTHQAKLVKALNLERVRSRSKSFDKLVRTLGELCGVPAPPRPQGG